MLDRIRRNCYNISQVIEDTFFIKYAPSETAWISIAGGVFTQKMKRRD